MIDGTMRPECLRNLSTVAQVNWWCLVGNWLPFASTFIKFSRICAAQNRLEIKGAMPYGARANRNKENYHRDYHSSSKRSKAMHLQPVPSVIWLLHVCPELFMAFRLPMHLLR